MFAGSFKTEAAETCASSGAGSLLVEVKKDLRERENKEKF